MRNKVFEIVQKCYDIIEGSVWFWMILIKNLFVYGWVEAFSQIVSYFDKGGSNCLTFRQHLKEQRNDQRKIPHEKALSFLLTFMLGIWILITFLLSKNQTGSFMIQFFEIVSTLLLAFYISYLLMTIALNLSNASQSKNLLILAFLTVCKKPLISTAFVACIILAVIIGRLNLVVLLFIIPGLCAFAIQKLSKNLIR